MNIQKSFLDRPGIAELEELFMILHVTIAYVVVLEPFVMRPPCFDDL